MGFEALNISRRFSPDTISAPRTGKCEVGVLQLIEWAFQREFASLDFDEVGRERGMLPSVGVEWIMMEQAKLGRRVDGGGRSDPHHDADIVASALAVLPEVYGGKRMAVQIAELARAGQHPDWMGNAQPTCEPMDWRNGKHGRYAQRELCREIGARWPGDQVPGKSDGYWCPVVYTNTARDVAAARRRYLAWYGALLELRHVFQIGCHLTSFVVTDRMPPQNPWKRIIDRSKVTR
jgi:hypothetical protein